MYIKVEPAEFFMYRVIMIFDLDKPDSEDQPVRDYMEEWELEPKYQRVGDFEGSNAEFMQFGGCYLGRHLGKMAEIQRSHVQAELLTAEIERLLALPEYAVAIPDERKEAAMKQLVETFHDESNFRAAESGELEAVLNGEAVKEAALGVLAGPS